MLPFGTSRLERVNHSGTVKLFLTIISHYFVVLLSMLRQCEANLSLSSHPLKVRDEISLEYSIMLHSGCVKSAIVSTKVLRVESFWEVSKRILTYEITKSSRGGLNSVGLHYPAWAPHRSLISFLLEVFLTNHDMCDQ